MTASNQGHTFTAVVTYGNGEDNAPHWTADHPIRSVDTHQSVKKPLYYMRFSTYLPDDAVKLAYAATDNIEADDNIVVIDRSTAAPENSPDLIAGEETFLSNSYSSFYENILITDVYTEVIPSQPVKPLFYRHLLSGDVTTSTVHILDSSFNRLNSNSYRVIEHLEYDNDGVLTGNIDSVAVYNSLQNSFDEDSGELVAYYVQYVDADGVIQTVLLNNELAYREATFDDMDWSTLLLKTWAKAYIIKQVGNYYEFTLPTLTTYSARYEEGIRLRVEKPVVDSNEQSWFVRVTNGSFTHTMGTNTYRYHVPEFSDQQFNPVEPYKLIAGEEINKVAPGLVQLKHIQTALADLPADIIIKDKDGVVLHALTTNTLKTGDTHYEDGIATGATWDIDKILSFDSQSGLVQLDVNLKDYYTITATYYYIEKLYEFTLVNLNPLTNTDVLENFYVIYLVPETDANSGLETAIHYLRVGRNGLVKACSQDAINGIADPSINVIGLPYGRPLIQAIPGTGDGVLGHQFLVYPDGVEGKHDFLREYTLEAPDGFPGQDYPNRYLVLAELSVIHQTSVNDTIILDNRLRGGGIKDKYDDEAKLLNPEVSWYGDIGLGGGIPYPGKSVAIVRLPHCLLEEYGGPFTEAEIKEVVKRHMPFGHYPVLDFYGVVPDVSIEELAVGGSLTIYWPSEGSDCTYNVYYSTGERYSKFNGSPIADDTDGNSYTLTGLTENLTYNIYVRAISENPCGIPITFATVCGVGGDPDVSEDISSGWGSHEGPPSITLQIKTLETV